MCDVSPNKFSSKGYNSKGTDNKLSKIIYLVCLIVIIITVLLLLIVLGINAGISSSLTSKSIFGLNEASKLQELELLRNKYFSILSGLKFNMSRLSGLFTDGNSNFIKLIREISINSRLKDATVNKHIDFILNGTFGRSILFPAPSCQSISTSYPALKSDHYWVITSSGSRLVYCDLTTICGNIAGGLTRVGVLNLENRPQVCSGDFVTVDRNSRCLRSIEEPGCSHIVFPVWNVSYSHICGAVEAYFLTSPDGFNGSSTSPNTSINDNYVNGISLTYGKAPNRTHIWTFIAHHTQNCTFNKPHYVGNNFSCLKWEDSCSTSTHSCTHSFYMQLQEPTTEDIELRLCQDKNQEDEVIYVENFEITVR